MRWLLPILLSSCGVLGDASEVPDLERRDKTSSLELTVLSSGSLMMDGKTVTETQLRAAITSSLQEADKPEDVACSIRAEKDVAHSRVVSLTDMLKKEGITVIALQNLEAVGSDPRIPLAPATP